MHLHVSEFVRFVRDRRRYFHRHERLVRLQFLLPPSVRLQFLLPPSVRLRLVRERRRHVDGQFHVLRLQSLLGISATWRRSLWLLRRRSLRPFGPPSLPPLSLRDISP